jgi:hypothetical protein
MDMLCVLLVQGPPTGKKARGVSSPASLNLDSSCKRIRGYRRHAKGRGVLRSRAVQMDLPLQLFSSASSRAFRSLS